MDILSSFIPMDRRQALAAGAELPDRATGAALLADLAGYTALTAAFAAALGPQHGAEALTYGVNRVYAALIGPVHHWGGSVLGFSGDAFLAWFDDDRVPSTEYRVPRTRAGGSGNQDDAGFGTGAIRAATAALAMQAAMAGFATIPLPGGGSAPLGLKIALAAGSARRFLVGDPALGRLDVLAGPAVARAGELEALAAAGEILLDDETRAALEPAGAQISAWPAGTAPDPPSTIHHPTFVLVGLARPAQPAPWPQAEALPEAVVRPWVLPAVYARLRQAPEEFLTELRPAIALFLHFSGVDYIRPLAGTRLDTFVRWVQSVLAHYEASLLQLTVGDKGSYLYAAFGAPVAHAGEEARAVAAALELRSPPAQCAFIQGVQVGLSAGLLRAGPYGGAGSQTYGVLGDAVNVAARLMQAAAPGSVLATRELRQAAGAGFRWTPLPPLTLKGKREPVAAYGLVGESAGRGLGLLEPAYTTPLVGRTAEAAVLADRLTAAGAGHGQIVAVTGEAGLGKSRLLAEGVRQARAGGFAVYGGAAQSYGTHTSYLAWQTVWRSFFDLEPDGSLDEQTGQVEDALGNVDERLLGRLPLLGTILNLALSDNELTATMDPKLRKESLEGLLLDLLRARAVRPVLLVLEDCQWLDPLSHELLEAIGRAIVHLPVLLLLAYRPPDLERLQAPRVESLPHFRAIPLAQLSDAEAAALIAARLGVTGPEVLPGGLVSELAQRAEGNPFFVEELLAYLAERGIQPLEPGALADLEWPASLQSLLLARIDQLTEGQRTVLKVASVVGRLFRRRELWGVYPELGEEAQVIEALTVLDRLGLAPLYVPAPDWAYLFKHLVTREVAHGSLPRPLRERLHGQFAAWLEAGSPEQSAVPQGPAPVDLLAHHYGQSANRAKASEYYRLAGDAAAAAWNNAAAVAYYEEVLNLVPATAQAGVLLALGDVLERQGAWEAATERYTAALAVGDASERARAHLGLGVVDHRQAAYAQAIPRLEEAAAAYQAAGDAAGEGRALAELGRVYFLQAAYAEARVVLGRAQEAAQRAGDRVLHALALNNLGNVAWSQAEFGAAWALHEQSLALRRALGHRWGVAASLHNLGLVAQARGEHAAALALYEESLGLLRELGDRWGMANCLQNLGLVALADGERGLAAGRIGEALQVCRTLGTGGLTRDTLVSAAGVLAPGASAARLLGAVARLLATQGGPLWTAEQEVYEQAQADTRAALGAAAYAEAFAAGQTLDWQEAVEEGIAALAAAGGARDAFPT